MNDTKKPEPNPEAPPKNGIPDGADQDEPKGGPTSDRHETETAAT